MAPTTLVEQKTSTTLSGRDSQTEGAPIRAAELLNTLEAPYFITRCSVHNPAQVRKTRKNIAKALRYQDEGRGYSFVEVLSMCPTGWGKVSSEIGGLDIGNVDPDLSAGHSARSGKRKQKNTQDKIQEKESITESP